ncbi:uncharacterized protein N7459_006675 [Penicillium hispanicum]|uniref:uncharacterized protein n=1 Tax=Penicillium hispanicum TaxID=1080232 RepID=UPI002542679C|nr:uncharacterized protein N7459_006675 [Penicillium hispanicum]KAJ5577711.1 hypothetical protein N7459_006675 [Penicillium hispanicum]
MEWDPSCFFCVSGCSSPYALLVLNQPINESAFEVLSEHGELDSAKGWPSNTRTSIHSTVISAEVHLASFIICADGGANRLYDMMKTTGKESINLPDSIVGDLDSLHPAVRQHYAKLGVEVLQDPDQYSTDFTKCLKYLNKHAAEIVASPRQTRISPASSKEIANANNLSRRPTSDSALDILILGGLGGRVDQAFSQIHHLYTMAQTQREFREATSTTHESHNNALKPSVAASGNLFLISEESITFILQEGKNVIHTPATNRPDIDKPVPGESGSELRESSLKRKRDHGEAWEYFFEENIGIIPLLGPASITTHGFEWDVQDWPTAIGGQLSTSNHIRADKVEVETSMPVLFTVELAQRLKRG